MMDIQTVSSATPQAKLLPWALRANAIFCALSGLLMLVAARPLAGFLGWPDPLALSVAGGVLILYAPGLLWTAAQSPVPRSLAITAVVLDLAWVAGSLVLVFGPWALFTTGGRWAVLAVADIVAAFAVVQTYGLWKRRG
jgi:multisubunit Na+/H+ antiporter MnhC subunit